MADFDHPVQYMDCSTGEWVVRDPTDEEVAQRKKDTDEAATASKRAEKDQRAHEQRRDKVLQHLADATGLKPDEIRRAINA